MCGVLLECLLQADPVLMVVLGVRIPCVGPQQCQCWSTRGARPRALDGSERVCVVLCYVTIIISHAAPSAVELDDVLSAVRAAKRLRGPFHLLRLSVAHSLQRRHVDEKLVARPHHPQI